MAVGGEADDDLGGCVDKESLIYASATTLAQMIRNREVLVEEVLNEVAWKRDETR